MTPSNEMFIVYSIRLSSYVFVFPTSLQSLILSTIAF